MPQFSYFLEHKKPFADQKEIRKRFNTDFDLWQYFQYNILDKIKDLIHDDNYYRSMTYSWKTNLNDFIKIFNESNIQSEELNITIEDNSFLHQKGKEGYDWSNKPESRGKINYYFKPEDIIMDNHGFYDYGDSIRCLNPIDYEIYTIYYDVVNNKKILDNLGLIQL